MREPLVIAEALLRKYGHDRQAKRIGWVAVLGATGDVRFVEEAVSEAVWGGPGAIWDLDHLSSSAVSAAERREDQRAYLRCLIVFAEQLEAAGYGNARTRETANRLRRIVAQAV